MKKSDWSTRPLEDELGEVLRAELLSWPGVRVRPMMGSLAFFRDRPRQKRGGQMLGCYVNRTLAKKKTSYMNRPGEPSFVWVRLRGKDAERALRRRRVREARLGFKGWAEISLASRDHLEEAVRWLGCAYERPARTESKRKGREATRKGA
jgi:hypothetical protein